MTRQSRVVFSFDKDEIIPTFLSFGHGLKEENMCLWETVSCVKILDGTKTECIKRAFYKNLTIDILLTLQSKIDYDILEKGVAKIHDKEYSILDLRTYNSLQIGEACYDNISVIKLPFNIFESAGVSTDGASCDSGLNASLATSVANMMAATEIIS